MAQSRGGKTDVAWTCPLEKMRKDKRPFISFFMLFFIDTVYPLLKSYLTKENGPPRNGGACYFIVCFLDLSEHKTSIFDV